MHLGEIENMCKDFETRLGKRAIPPQVRRKISRDLAAFAREVIQTVRAGRPDANEIAKYALMSPVIQRGIAENLKE